MTKHQCPMMRLGRILVDVGVSLFLAICVVGPTCRTTLGQSFFEQEPINYHTAPVNDPVARLQEAIAEGDVALEFDERHGYLKSVLRSLGISTSSQMLVFSKTSFQRSRISPSTPRALYFNADVYIGWVQGGQVIEVSSVDARQGTIFYTLAQKESASPRFVRDRGDCLSCHASSRTRDVPGSLVRSVYPSPTGQPHFDAGTFRTNHSSPFAERWGGWYVTGTHGVQRHMGNAIASNADDPEKLDKETHANLKELGKLVVTSPYLAPHSDIVALMVLEHQTDMHNLITRANYDTRRALRDAAVLNEMLNEPADRLSPSIRRRIANAGEKLLKYMLFADEARLTDAVQGTSAFAAEFLLLGPRDSQGRSLRQFDLKRRLFKYPCSYLIYSDAFGGLPEQVKQHVYDRLREILTNKDTNEDFSHLSGVDRKAISEILQETKPDLAEYWKRKS